MKHVLHELAAVARRQLPWWLLGATGVAVVTVLAAGAPAVEFWTWTMLATAVTAGLVSSFANGNPPVYGIVVLAGVVQLTQSEPFRSYTTSEMPSLAQSASDVAVALGLATLLGWSTWRRVGRPKPRDVVEMVVVFLGAVVSTWVLLAQPLVEQGEAPAMVVLISALLPINVLVATFVIDMWTDGLRDNRAIQLASVAAAVMTVASIDARLDLVSSSPSTTPAVPLAAYSIAAGFMFAAMSHGHFQHHLVARPAARGDGDSKPRLAIMAAAVLVAVTLMSTIAPADGTDMVVRAVGTLVMVALVVLRLTIALAQHERARATLERRINLDDLTGLPTRARVIELARARLEENWRTGRYPTVLHLNIDRFKHINDSLGHQGANRVLAAVAERLEATAASFGADVGRLGGDDFVIIDGSTHSLAEACDRVDAVRRALAEPVMIDDATVVIGASIGVAIAPEKRITSAEELLRRADVANHQAKLDGANKTAVFDDAMQAAVAQKMDLENALHGAIGRREMQLFHQPIIDVRTGEVSGFESLIRWQRPSGELVPPGAFISIAEDTGIICEIGAWAITDALSSLRVWIDTAVVGPETTMSVNVSPRQVADPSFAQIVREALDTTGLPPRLLWLEITESMMLEEPELAERTLSELRSMGIRIALDDFGTGYSSLSLLQQFPIDRIKIDRAFVQGIADNTNDRSLVRTIIAMAHSMGLDLVAEGVETVHQLRSLRELGCSKAQGFLISHPVPADAMRTTMSALSELASLSVFAAGPGVGATEPMAPRIEHEPDPVVHTAASPPLGSSVRGPLGVPVF